MPNVDRENVTVKAPTGFASLGKAGTITKTFDDKSIFTVQIDHMPTPKEINSAVRSIDRLHAFQQGQAVGLLLWLREEFKNGGSAETPEALVKALRKRLETIQQDLTFFCTLTEVQPEQLILGEPNG